MNDLLERVKSLPYIDRKALAIIESPGTTVVIDDITFYRVLKELCDGRNLTVFVPKIKSV